LDSNGQAKVVAQFRVKKIPFINTGVADVEWGPLWNNNGDNSNFDELRLFLRHVKKEYTEKRGLITRIWPRSTYSEEGDTSLSNVFAEEGFEINTAVRPYHTVMIDLTKPLDVIRGALHRKWRNHLNVAERAALENESGNSIEYFDRFYSIYKTMWGQKRFPTGVRLPIIRELQAQLPHPRKLLITIIHDGQIDIGATVCAVFGDTMLYFLGATVPNLRSKSRPGYLLQWLHIQKAKELGMRWYDLGGYDDDNQAIAGFKKRMNGLQIVFPGQFEFLPNQKSSKFYDFMENTFRNTRRMVTGR